MAAILALGTLLAVGCNNKNDETASGLKYKIIKSGEGEKIQQGQIVTLNLSYGIGDSTMFNSTEDPSMGAMAMQFVDSIWKDRGMIYEGIAMLKKGDSAEFIIPAKDFFFKSLGEMVMPEGFNETDNLVFYVGVANFYTEDEYKAYQIEMMEKMNQEAAGRAEAQVGIDIETIESYLKENNLTASSTESGLRYIITKPGSGARPEPGDSVYVHYTGMLLDGTKFDSSLDRGEPLAFPIGQGWVIPGWDEGIALLNKGAKGTLYIPSSLAYGERGAGQLIRPNSILVFEVELVDLKKRN
jgi:FKBP-type peptidyl-prolyl cis-trans isomerase FkpA